MKTILFVENEPIVQTMCRANLQREGFLIEMASDGLAALKILSERKPDLAVIELRLSKLNGVDVLKFIRSNARISTMPVIMLTEAHLMNPAQDAALATANRQFLKTECNAAILVQTIKDLLSTPVATAPASSAPPIDAGIKLKMAGEGSAAKPATTAEAKQSRPDVLKVVLAEIAKIREYAMAYTKTPPPSPSGPENLAKLHGHVRSLHTTASQNGFPRVARITKAFDALLAEICAIPSRLTPSVPDTLVEAADSLGVLLKTDGVSTDPIAPGKVLAIDDDPVCNHAVVNSLKRAQIEATSMEDPVAGLKLLETTPFDLVLLDINMPQLTGFEAAEKLRHLPSCKNTTVIFITAHSNFKNRTQGILSGGSDFITKPVSPLELALKVNIHLLKPRLHRVVPQTTEVKPKPAPVAETPQPIVFVPAAEEPMVEPVIVVAQKPVQPEPPMVAPVVAAPITATPVIEEKPVLPVEVPVVKTPVVAQAPVVEPIVVAPVVEQKPVQPKPIEMPIAEPVSTDEGSVFLTRESPVQLAVEAILPPPSMSIKKPVSAPPLVAPTPYKNGLTPMKKSSAPAFVPPKAQPKASGIVRTNFFQTLNRAAGNGAPTLNNKTRNISMKTDNNTFDKVAIEVTRIIFGDENVNEMNVRLVKIALERYNVHEMISQSAEPGRIAA